MTSEKFETEITTLKKFFEVYCKGKHEHQTHRNKELIYKNKTFKIELDLCEECLKDIKYSFNRLLECPHEEKPRCRKCPNPCYDKIQWKKTAKVMKYSGIKLGLSSIKRKMDKIFKI